MHFLAKLCRALSALLLLTTILFTSLSALAQTKTTRALSAKGAAAAATQQQQQKRVGGKKSDAGNARINTRQSEKPAAKAIAAKKETGEAQPLAVCAQNQPINFGQTVNGTLANGDCLNPVEGDGTLVDEYTFNGTAGQQISVSMSSTDFDTVLYLLRPDGTVLSANDDIDPNSTPPNRNSRVPVTGLITMPTSGLYSILANSFAPESRGAYTLTLTAVTTCNLTPIAFGETKTGTLSSGDCTNPIDEDGTFVDFYTFNGTAGHQVSITMTATTPGNVNPFLYFLLPNGDLLADDNDGGGGTSARIPQGAGFGRLPVTGTYTIVANTVATNQSGNYNLTLMQAATDCASVPLTLGTPVNGVLTNGDCRLLEDSSFVDAYTFTGAANAQIAITMASSTAGLTPVVFLLSPTGDVLVIDANNDGDNTARIPGTGSFTLPATGTYTVLANSFQSGQTGDYTLALTRSVQQNAHTISGQVTGGGVGLSGVTLSLSGGASATTTTDANGNYSFVEFAAGNNYTITPTNTAQYSFTPQTVTALQADQTVNFNGTLRTPQIIISEFRFRGTAGATDEFVELYNQTDQTVDITGWSLVSGGTVLHTIASGSIPARSHYLITGASYSLPTASDAALGLDIPDNAAVALFNNSTNFATGTRLDAVGFSTADALYIEGGGLSPASGINTDSEHAFVRKLTSGTPQDTDNNSADFVLVATDPIAVGNNAVLGAPGAENRMSPTQRNASIKGSLIDPMAASTAPPNRVRSSFGANPVNAAYGTLSIQRRFKNATGAPVTRLRFRIVDITTLNSPVTSSPQADLRVLSSTGVVRNSQGQAVVTVTGLTLEEPPAQAIGGGLNSTLTITLPGGGLAAGNTIDVQFLLGVQQQGDFRFIVNVEGLVGPTPDPLGATKSGSTKADGSRKEK